MYSILFLTGCLLETDIKLTYQEVKEEVPVGKLCVMTITKGQMKNIHKVAKNQQYIIVTSNYHHAVS